MLLGFLTIFNRKFCYAVLLRNSMAFNGAILKSHFLMRVSKVATCFNLQEAYVCRYFFLLIDNKLSFVDIFTGTWNI